MHTSRWVGLTLVIGLSASTPAHAQCQPEWLGRPEQGWIGTDGSIFAMVSLDSSSERSLVVGGGFRAIGRATGRGIARWDGTEWYPLGSGFSKASGSPGAVFALAVMPSGAITAAGNFAFSGTVPMANIAQWTGNHWSPLGAGLEDFGFALTQFRGDLVAGGRFEKAGGARAASVAAWDGVTWRPLGNGMPNWVYALAVYDGELIAASTFTLLTQPTPHLARWDGVRWHDFGGGLSGLYPEVRALTVYGSDLVAVGQFSHAGGIAANGVARWDGVQWHAIGQTSAIGGPRSVFAHGSDLYVGRAASFTNVTRWDGVVWHNLGSAVDGSVNSIVESAGEIIAGGNFEYAGETRVNACAAWNGTEWNRVSAGFDRQVRTLIVHDDALVAGGAFGVASGTPASGIARFNGTQWEPIGFGLPGAANDLHIYGGELIAAGSLSGGNIYRWNGSSWSLLGGGVNAMVSAIDEHNGDLIVGGLLTAAAGQPASRIAGWDGASWHALGSGINPGPINVSGTLPEVKALVVHQRALIVGGKFNGAGGMSAMNVARWDGSAWSPLGTGLGDSGPHSSVRALAEFQGQLIAGGSSLGAGGGQILNVLRWTGSHWEPLGGPADDWVTMLKVINGELIAGGEFESICGVAASRLARWDGSTWHPYGQGLNYLRPADAYVLDVASFNGELVVGGEFVTAGGRVSPFLARWGCRTCYPDCTGDGSLAPYDFVCFLQAFLQADPYTDCNNDGLFSVADFACFQRRYVEECN